MERISKEDVLVRTRTLNRILRDDIHVIAQGRMGYVGLDLYHGTTLVRTLTTGTKREIYMYLGAMLDALDIVGRVGRGETE